MLKEEYSLDDLKKAIKYVLESKYISNQNICVSRDALNYLKIVSENFKCQE